MTRWARGTGPLVVLPGHEASERAETRARRAGRRVRRRSFSSRVSPLQVAISSRVRQHPRQYPVVGSRTHTSTHGEGTSAGSKVMSSRPSRRARVGVPVPRNPLQRVNEIVPARSSRSQAPAHEARAAPRRKPRSSCEPMSTPCDRNPSGPRSSDTIFRNRRDRRSPSSRGSTRDPIP